MYTEFKDKTVLITGGTTGIGKATALAFASFGANVVICGRNGSKAETILTEAATNNLKVEFKQCDVSRAEEVRDLINYIVSSYGKLDIAFNNAGIDGNKGFTHECDIQNWRDIIDINLSGVFYCLKYEINAMLEAGGGRIVNNASVSGHRGYKGNPGYISSKHGLIGLTKASAMENADKNIRINSISPGVIVTPMIPEDKLDDPKFKEWVKKVEPMQRTASAKEVANSVLWLCSSQSSYTTGHDLAVDGGILAI